MRIWWKHGQDDLISWDKPNLVTNYCEPMRVTDSETAATLADRYLTSLGASLYENQDRAALTFDEHQDSVRPIFVEAVAPELLIPIARATDNTLADLVDQHLADLDRQLLMMISTLAEATFDKTGLIPDHVALVVRSRPTAIHTQFEEPTHVPKVGSLASMNLAVVGSMQPPRDFIESFSIQWGSRPYPSLIQHLGRDEHLGTKGDTAQRIRVARAHATTPQDVDPATWEAERDKTQNPVEINEPKERRLGFADLDRNIRLRTPLYRWRSHKGLPPSGARSLP